MLLRKTFTFVLIATLVLLVSVTATNAQAPTPDPVTVTACFQVLGPDDNDGKDSRRKGGRIYSLAVGDDPLQPCRTGDTIVRWHGGDITTNPDGAIQVGGTIRADAFASNSPLIFEAPAGTERMRIDDVTGNVGIGTTNPTKKLSVDGFIKQTNGHMLFRDGFGNSVFVVQDASLPADPLPNNRFVFRSVPDLDAYAGGGPITRDIMTIENTGSVGIGVTDPREELHIREQQGSVDTEIILQYSGSGGGTPAIYTLRVLDDGTFSIRDRNVPGGPQRLTIDLAGNVGIGTTDPQRQLHITDAMRIAPSASPPASASLGDLYVDSSGALCFFDGTSWNNVAGSGSCS